MRLSTVGREVLDGNGLAVSDARGVSVNVSVGVTETVSVAVGTSGVSVTGANAVFVSTLVAGERGGIGVDVNVQANEVVMHKIKIKGCRLIRKIYSPFRILYPNNCEVKRFL